VSAIDAHEEPDAIVPPVSSDHRDESVKDIGDTLGLWIEVLSIVWTEKWVI
jgi:hypothetical protein